MGFEQAFNELKERAEQSIKRKDGDYIKDGLLHCGKCHTPKQTRVILCNKEITPFCVCKCESKRIEAEKKKHIAERRRSECFGNSSLRNCTFAADDKTNEKLTNAMQAYVDNFTTFKRSGKGLLLYGSVGRGKTFAAAEVANALIDKGYSAYFANISKISKITYAEQQGFIDRLDGYSMLIIDDFSAERKTEYTQEMIYTIINNRCDIAKPMILTTNLTATELKNPQDRMSERIFDRIMKCCQPIEVTGINRRHVETTNDFDKINKILGL